jgi:alkylhydroperoxidase/carboxymuconolactone decarboxylase family protein YurZ
VFGDIWERTELSSRDRSLIIAALITGGNTEQLPATSREPERRA